ncbi:addiction module protein [Mycolicibacterium mengxianglii]|uniref:addiction module protein n=1 Tax=Mycolicibacterium mengxianglii TaxID=2736649 RepID=UPI001E58B174|nr:addiction module protein [Mycolicibacterium mengxianglii]
MAGGDDVEATPAAGSRDDEYGRVRVRVRVQRVLDQPLTVGALIEAVLWVALPYVVIGVIYASCHIELMGQLESAFSARFTVFADLVSLATLIGLWPMLLASSLLCGVAGCGVLL